MRKYVFLIDWDVETPSPESITIPEPPESRRTSWGCEGQKKIRKKSVVCVLNSNRIENFSFVVTVAEIATREMFFTNLNNYDFPHDGSPTRRIFISPLKKKTWDELQVDVPKLQDKYSFLKFRDSHHVQLNPEFLEFHLPSKSLFRVDWEFQTIRHTEFEGSSLTKLHSELQNWIYFRKITWRFSSFT